ncbi:dTDP-4-dehydrorhamnose 3,5-epimerase family protein [Saccharomonospora glauca]|jgi:NDP-hexose 3,5-(Or5-) epimerase|uniref:dTDP-4-dehydrorhamnose 3,5-epimerase-like enzyme n=1 Tax=Saccharomonospora glauca K62 TaxID=928724 RepID=I1D203_9PSEU|nr:dTDP-4-dehydrorhamnose 3,5-epimerase family protein [Saccharomonospora glauca]EIE98977.1 dTDP-4-dehydrorhamnose 3,5-epimerase-like enzyme [Saccharomonospora glauca K62]
MSSLTITETSLPNAFHLRAQRHFDRRGFFYEAFRSDDLSEAIGYPFRMGQFHYSISCRDTIRGIHGTLLPPGQAKLVTCVRGEILDVAVDLRTGSPTFGRYEVFHQQAGQGTALYLSDGIGHAFQALTDDTCVTFVCSEAYQHGTMLEINPLDPELGIPWKLSGEPVMSAKDAAAPTLSAAAAAGLLPHYRSTLAHYERLNDL